MHIITFCAVAVLALSCVATPVPDVDNLREYVKEIQSQMDDTVKPCENFAQYACGKVMHGKMHSVTPDIKTLLKDDLLNFEPKTEDEKLVKTFYMSCKNSHQIGKFLKEVNGLETLVPEWPVTREYTGEEISRLFAYLASVEFSGFLSIDLEDLHDENVINLNINARPMTKELLSKTLEDFGGASEKTVQDIVDLTNALSNVETDESNEAVNKFNNVAELKEAVPNVDWDTYFTVFAKEFDLDVEDFLKKPVHISDLEKMKKQIEILKAADSKTIVNYIVWRFFNIVLHFDCEKLVESIVKPLLVIRYVHEDDNYKNFFSKELATFQNFEKSLSELRSQLNNPESDSLKNLMKIKSNVYGNYEEYLSGNYLSKLLKNVELNDKTLYANLIKIMHAVYKNFIVNGLYGEVMSFGDFIMTPLGKYVMNGNRQRASLNNFITTNNNLWAEVVMADDIYENRTISENCLVYPKTYNEPGRNMVALNRHSGYHVALQDYLHFVNEHEDQLKKHNEVLTEAGLNHAKVYMLALAQEQCVESGTQTLKDDDYLLSFFKHSKQFSDTWGCVAGDTMNKVCDDSTFVPKF